LEFAQSIGNACVEPVILPLEIVEQALESRLIDGYCSGLPPRSSETSGVLRGIHGSPERREMAILVSKGLLNKNRPLWLKLINSLKKAQELLEKPSNVPELARRLKDPAEPGHLDIRAAITDVYGTQSSNESKDPGVLSSSMKGGIIKNSPQWEVVLTDRNRRLGIPHTAAVSGNFFDGDLLHEIENSSMKKGMTAKLLVRP